MDSVLSTLTAFQPGVQIKAGLHWNSKLVGNCETLVSQFPDFARKQGGFEVAVLSDSTVRVYFDGHTAGGDHHVDLATEEPRTTIPVATVEVARSVGGPAFDAALAALQLWMQARHFTGDGFPDKAALAVMLAVSERQRGSARGSGASVLQALQHFFALYAAWPWGEQSVGRQCGRAKRGAADLMAEDERLVSEDEPEETDEAGTAAAGAGAAGAGPGQLQLQSQRVPWHSRLCRATVGQFRDLRRLKEFPGSASVAFNKPVKLQNVAEIPVSVSLPASESGWNSKTQLLDNLDVMAVLSPTVPTVNLAVRVTESHKKLLVQELHRCALLLADVQELSVSDLLAATTCSPALLWAPLGGALVFQAETTSLETRDVLRACMESEIWRLVHDMQGFAGIALRPLPASTKLPPLRRALGEAWMPREYSQAVERKLVTQHTVTLLLGFAAVAQEPYVAEHGLAFDAHSLVQKTLSKTRDALAKKPLETPRLANKFFLSGGSLTGTNLHATLAQYF